MMITVPKLVLIIVLIAIVWFAMRWLDRGQSALARRRRQPSPRPQRQGAIEDLVACRVCGAYVAAGARGCGKPACPQPR